MPSRLLSVVFSPFFFSPFSFYSRSERTNAVVRFTAKRNFQTSKGKSHVVAVATAVAVAVAVAAVVEDAVVRFTVKRNFHMSKGNIQICLNIAVVRISQHKVTFRCDKIRSH